jgi:hypothetical protein
MARKTKRVGIPNGQPDKFVDLAKKILKKHKELGVDSPLKSIQMDVFEAQLNDAESKRTKSKELRMKSEALMQEANNKLGLAKGQNLQSTDTVYSLMTHIRDMLLVMNRNHEEKLSEWGFEVVVGVAKAGKKTTEPNNK